MIPSAAASYSADLIGVADWSEGSYTSGTHKVVLRVEDSSQSQAFHVIYNRAKG